MSTVVLQGMSGIASSARIVFWLICQSAAHQINSKGVYKMKAHFFILAEGAYCTIRCDDFVMDVRLDAGRSAKASLLRTAAEMRQKAADYVKRADRITAAAELV